MKRYWLLLAGIAVVAIAMAAQGTYRLTINGKSVPGSAIVVKGETYVPLKSLEAAGVKSAITKDTLSLTLSPAGGSNQGGAVEGPMNEWLFNGVWRFRVLSVDKASDGSGWEVKVELRNGTKTDQLALGGTGYDSLKLVLSDGKLLDCSNPSDMRDTGFAQASGQTFVLRFSMDDIGDQKPDRLLLLLKPDADLKKYMKDSLKASYSVPDPSFRVKLSG